MSIMEDGRRGGAEAPGLWDLDAPVLRSRGCSCDPGEWGVGVTLSCCFSSKALGAVAAAGPERSLRTQGGWRVSCLCVRVTSVYRGPVVCWVPGQGVEQDGLGPALWSSHVGGTQTGTNQWTRALFCSGVGRETEVYRGKRRYFFPL